MVRGGKRLGPEEIAAMLSTPSLADLGRMADAARRARWGDRATWIRNRQINPTNVCTSRCRFCDFSVPAGSERAYAMEPADAAALVPPDAREAHVVGGLHPEWPLDRYLDIVRAIKAARPGIHVKAYTAVEIDHFVRISGLSLEDVLARLGDAGVDMLPGGGAEIFSERLRGRLWPRKIPAARWLEIHAAAHRLGIPSNATMLYGHEETIEDRARHLLALRDAQDEAPGFVAFIPLRFQPGATGIRPGRSGAVDDLRTVAASRLALDNFPHVKAYWAMLGLDTAAMALRFGADEMEGTVGEERIAHAAGAATPVGLTPAELRAAIEQAGCTPVERDGLYRPV